MEIFTAHLRSLLPSRRVLLREMIISVDTICLNSGRSSRLERETGGDNFTNSAVTIKYFRMYFCAFHTAMDVYTKLPLNLYTVEVIAFCNLKRHCALEMFPITEVLLGPI